ncbi:MAG: putative rane-associated protein-like protein [Frankiales bacterium]|nr:putative rane-associated protein-like protein [Frankiales bacterium]
MARIINDILSAVPHWTVYLLVFLLPFLEASVLLGFVIPGETALVFGGVLASSHKDPASLTVVLVLAILGAVVGDTVGYEIGSRFGPALQRSRLGLKVGAERWASTEAFLDRRGGTAVFFGRWTALLRAMVPGAAGMSSMHYKTFLLWNFLGGALWAVACVVGGYLAGDVVLTYVDTFGYLILGVVVVLGAFLLVKHRRSVTSDPT